MTSFMDQPFPKSIPLTERCDRLFETLKSHESLGIVMSADPDAMASALALKRLMWRRVKRVMLYHVNPIERPDNLALIKLLKIKQNRIRSMKGRKIKRWAMVDSQPAHYKPFRNHLFDIVIDHHPLLPSTKAHFLDIREDYGANSTIMTEYLRAAKITPPPALATALFYGIKTDTNNFTRESLPKDINAFQYLYRYANMNTIKKIESSEITRDTLDYFRFAMEHLILVHDIAFVHMDQVSNPDDLVIIADFFMKLAEAQWSVVTGVYEGKLIVILRNADFRGDAGKRAKEWFSSWEGLAGGHKSAARAEIPLENIYQVTGKDIDLDQLILKKIKGKA
ncbi:MAG: DHH family phosphoesterase [Desulfatiglandaceae bacterium]